jgi:hypothetical protein
MARTSALASIDHADAIDPDDCRTALGEDARRVLSIFLAALKSRAVIFVLTDDESAVIAQERKRKSGGGWCSELIAGITATTSFPGLITLAKIATVFSPIVGMLVRMRSEKFVLSYRNCYGAGEGKLRSYPPNVELIGLFARDCFPFVAAFCSGTQGNSSREPTSTK